MKTKQSSLTTKYTPRQRRIFSKELKRKLVEEIEHKRLKVKDVVNLYNVSTGIVYQWLRLYTSMNIAGVTMVVETESKESKLEQLYRRINDLERMLGKKQMEIEFKDKVIEICSNELGYDIKKKVTIMQ
jgi:transposase